MSERMPPKVYIETSVVSYLTSLPSRDIVVAAHQQLTHAWWAAKARYDLFVSEAVVAERAAGILRPPSVGCWL